MPELGKTLLTGIAGVWIKTWRWLMWTICLGAATPIGVLFVALYLVHNKWPEMSGVIGHGELFLIAGVLTIGELEGLRTKTKKSSVEAMHVISLIIVLFSIATWNSIVADQTLHPRNFIRFSEIGGGIVLGATLISGAITRCVAKGGGKR